MVHAITQHLNIYKHIHILEVDVISSNIEMKGIILIGIGIAVGIIGTAFSLFLLPFLASRVVYAQNDTNISAIDGASEMLSMVMYGGIFASVIGSFGLIFIGLKAMTG